MLNLPTVTYANTKARLNYAVRLNMPVVCLFLLQEFQLLGLPTVTCNNKGQPDVCSVLNRAYDLFRCYQNIYSTKEELENR